MKEMFKNYFGKTRIFEMTPVTIRVIGLTKHNFYDTTPVVGPIVTYASRHIIMVGFAQSQLT